MRNNSDSDSEIGVIKIHCDETTEEKLIFVYQTSVMKHLCRLYDKHLLAII